ncbi:hypothetical protein N0V85_009144 [Neurospora sp. IMI 360204]|nr:hypothetical protein N0V85_009144 [Neurospora sp. IMI 360204]
MSANAMTTISQMLSSTMVTVIQPAPSTASAVTVYIPEPQSTASASSSAPSTWVVPEPYFSIVGFLAGIGGIIYLFGYTFPHCRKNIVKFFRRAKIRAEQLVKKREENEEKREKKEAKREEDLAMVETRTYQIHQIQSVEKLVNGQHAHVEESKGIRESVEKVVTGVQVMPEAMKDAVAGVIKEAVKGGYQEGFKDAMTGMEEIIKKAVMEGTREGIKDAMKEVNQATREATKEGILEGTKRLQGKMQGIQYTIYWVKNMVDWVLYHCKDHSEQLAILPKSLKKEVGAPDLESETTMEIEDPIDAGSEEWEEEDGDEEEEESDGMHGDDDAASTTSTAPTLRDFAEAEDQSLW